LNSLVDSDVAAGEGPAGGITVTDSDRNSVRGSGRRLVAEPLRHRGLVQRWRPARKGHS